MGARLTFTCGRCGLSGVVSGRPDRGFVLRTDTRYCPQCQTLFDAAISWAVSEDDPRRRSMEASIRFNECRSCHSTELLPWREGEPCPCCGSGSLECKGGIQMWD